MNDQKYNGWANYETWNVNLWIMNDEGLYDAWRDATANGWMPEQAESFVREIMPNGTPDFANMGGAGAYGKVDWDEIATAWSE